MSAKHPVIAVTGSSGAGTTTVTKTFQHIFRREKIAAALVEGDAFHRYDRAEMRERISEAQRTGRTVSHFGPEANLFSELEELFKTYGETGRGRSRKYLHDEEEAAGTDLLIGVVPIINLEWIQKIHRDRALRSYSVEAVVDTILRRMPDYVHYICPQFSRTHVNFQRVPTVDTSNPFIARFIPSADESFVVIRFRDPKGIDFSYLLSMLHDSFMSRPNSIVIPGGKLELAMQLIFTPMILQLVDRKHRAA